jgi:hypothetical protein
LARVHRPRVGHEERLCGVARLKAERNRTMMSRHPPLKPHSAVDQRACIPGPMVNDRLTDCRPQAAGAAEAVFLPGAAVGGWSATAGLPIGSLPISGLSANGMMRHNGGGPRFSSLSAQESASIATRSDRRLRLRQALVAVLLGGQLAVRSAAMRSSWFAPAWRTLRGFADILVAP